MPEPTKTNRNVLTAMHKLVDACEQAGILPDRVSVIKVKVFRNNEGRVIPDSVGGEFGMINRREIVEETDLAV